MNSSKWTNNNFQLRPWPSNFNDLVRNSPLNFIDITCNTVYRFVLSVFFFGQPFEGLSYPFLDFGQPFKFFAIRLSGYGIRLNARVSRLLSVFQDRLMEKC